jgi:YggT family protein
LSWISPYSPLAPLLTSVTRPFLRPFQKIVPPVANVDLSPLFVLIACQLLLIVPLAWLEAAVSRLL